MPVPDFQKFMNPILKYLSETKEDVKVSDMEKAMISAMHFTKEQAEETIKSGKNTIIYSRCHWATYYLVRAGLINRPQRGFFKISEEGLRVLKLNQHVDVEFLKRYPDFIEFLNSVKTYEQKKINDSQTIVEQETDPEERISQAIDELNAALEDDILASLKAVDPKLFEHIVVDLMEAMNYGVGTATRYVSDGGVDGIIDEDELGLSKIYLQAKRYNDGKVNEKEMRDFVGALATNNVSKGVFITTSSFADKAEKTAQNAHGHTIVLIDGKKLAKLMRGHGLGAKHKENYDIREFDASYLEG